jgi:polyhydroxyalkanoate synthesis regulator phasin
MPTELEDTFKRIIDNLSSSGKAIVISKEEGFAVYQEINREMKEFRREFTKKEKESQNATAKIVLTS